MNLKKSDAGKVFTAPSGRRVEFVEERSGRFLFRYQDDPVDGLALSTRALMILDGPERTAPADPKTKRD